jgi:hypothetical protein
LTEIMVIQNDIYWLVLVPIIMLVCIAVMSIKPKYRVRSGKAGIVIGGIELTYAVIGMGIVFLLRNNPNFNTPNFHLDYYGQTLFPLTIVIAIVSIALGIWLLFTRRKLEKIKPLSIL